MHIMDLGEFEELVHDIKCPLLFIFSSENSPHWMRKTITRLKGVYGERINIVELDVTNQTGILFNSRLLGLPGMALYKDGEHKISTHGLSTRDIENMIRRYGECDE